MPWITILAFLFASCLEGLSAYVIPLTDVSADTCDWTLW
jgi:hypothetical protein